MTTPTKTTNNGNQSDPLTDQKLLTAQGLKNNSPQQDSNQHRNFDIVLFGATSFVGKLTAEYLVKFLADNQPSLNADLSSSAHQDKANDKASKPLRFAIAGRDKDKLETLKQALLASLETEQGKKKQANNEKEGNETEDKVNGEHEENKENGENQKPPNVDIGVIVADSDDEKSLEAMVKQSRVIISTVGPYLQFGENLIKACATIGTDYLDLTGEAIFIKDMLDRYQDAAKASGARIVNACGFDSIPSDLGVYFTQKAAKSKFDAPCSVIHMRVKAAKGGLSGGTIASMATIFGEVGDDKSRRRQLANPYLLNDDPNAPSTRQEKLSKPKYDIEHHRWAAPFVMESINSRVVHRSNQLQDYAYGRDFRYDEAVWMGDGVKGQLLGFGMSAGIMAFALAMSNDTSRTFLADHVLPKSGSGPSKADQDNGYFDIRFFGELNGNSAIATKVTGNKDPGYGSTSRMLAQSALCLALDVDKKTVAGGFWTPATALGDKLIDRLDRFAEVQFSVVDDEG